MCVTERSHSNVKKRYEGGGRGQKSSKKAYSVPNCSKACSVLECTAGAVYVTVSIRVGYSSDVGLPSVAILP